MLHDSGGATTLYLTCGYDTQSPQTLQRQKPLVQQQAAVPKLCALVLQGEPSVFESETGREGMAEPVGRRRAYQMAGIDYDNCDTCQVALFLDFFLEFQGLGFRLSPALLGSHPAKSAHPLGLALVKWCSVC